MMKQQGKQLDAQNQFKVAMLKMMKDVELNQAKIHKLEADAILAVEQAGGVRTGHDIAMLDAQIGAARAKNEGIQSALKTMMELEKHMIETSQPQPEAEMPKEGDVSPKM